MEYLIQISKQALNTRRIGLKICYMFVQTKLSRFEQAQNNFRNYCMDFDKALIHTYYSYSSLFSPLDCQDL